MDSVYKDLYWKLWDACMENYKKCGMEPPDDEVVHGVVEQLVESRIDAYRTHIASLKQD